MTLLEAAEALAQIIWTLEGSGTPMNAVERYQWGQAMERIREEWGKEDKPAIVTMADVERIVNKKLHEHLDGWHGDE